MTDKEKIEQLTEALQRYVAVYGKTQLQADGLYTTAELMSKFGITALPENAVVLTREEWRDLHKGYGGMLYEIRQEVRKETAKAIIADVKSCMQVYEDDDDGYLLKKGEFEVFMREIANQFGVEVDD